MAIEHIHNGASNVSSYQTVLPVKSEIPSVIPESSDLPVSEQGKQKGNKNEEQLGNKTKEISKIVNRNTVAEFAYNESAHRISIKLKDRETNEVIKEIPSEEALALLARAWEITGALVDEKR